MRRLYFLTPNVESTKRIVDELLLARIEARHIHVIAKDPQLVEEQHLPEAGLMQQSDFIPALQRGAALGGVTGLLAGLVAIAIPPAGIALGGGAVLALTVAGAGVGSLASTLIGISVPNSRLKEFEQAIERGELLMLVDVPRDREGEITELVKKHHPEAEVFGTERPKHPVHTEPGGKA